MLLKITFKTFLSHKLKQPNYQNCQLNHSLSTQIQLNI